MIFYLHIINRFYNNSYSYVMEKAVDNELLGALLGCGRTLEVLERCPTLILNIFFKKYISTITIIYNIIHLVK
jgi:hypothetical protein